MITFTPHYNGFGFSLDGKPVSIKDIKLAGIKPTPEEVQTISEQIATNYARDKALFDASTDFLNQLINGNMISDIIIRDPWENPASTVLVDGNKASFHAYTKDPDGGRSAKFITRSIKNGKVVVDNVRYGLNKELIKRV